MKRIILLLMWLTTTNAFAQDVIVKKDGSTVLSRVLEVGEDEVKYKKHDNLNGPTYTIKKSELQSINYQNGAKDTFSAPVRENNRYLPNNQNDGTHTMNDNALLRLDAISNISDSKVKTLKTVGWVGGGALVGAGIVCMSIWSDSEDLAPSFALMGGGVAFTATFLLLANHQKKKIQKIRSMSIYHHDFQFFDGSSLSFGADLLCGNTMGSNALGLGLRYNF